MSKIIPAARTVIFDNEGKVAVIEAYDGEYYKIPGGGIEPADKVLNEKGEEDIEKTEEMAAKREAMEEAGCEIELLGKLGNHTFKDAKTDTFHESVGFLARAVGKKKEVNLEDHEKERKFKLMWLGSEEAAELFKKAEPKEDFKRSMNDRDGWFLEKGRKLFGELSNEALKEIKNQGLKLK